MSEVTNNPTHNRLLTKLRAMGPYLRDPQSKEGHYYFDCLSVCVDDRKSPELREFWGWWMVLESVEGDSRQNTMRENTILTEIGSMKRCLKKSRRK